MTTRSLHRRLGVCSWSLRQATPEALVESVRACGVSWVQLALGPLTSGAWDEHTTRELLAKADIGIVSGMMATLGEDYSTLDTIRETGGVRPDATWRANLDGARRAAACAQRLSIPLVTFHAGFLPHSLDDAETDRLVGRLCLLADIFAERGVLIALETGQETAASLSTYMRVLRGAAGINFDPANMILYGMGDPVVSLRTLAPHVRQIHIKDAAPARSSGQWGQEMRAGEGRVDWGPFFGLIRDLDLRSDLIIEREAGENRVDDVRAAAALVRRHAAETGMAIS